jgi:hypothetical protein
MQKRFYITGLMQVSHSGRSFQVYVLDDKGQRVFIGLVSRKALSALLQNQITQADICQFAETQAQATIQETLKFSLELKP